MGRGTLGLGREAKEDILGTRLKDLLWREAASPSYSFLLLEHFLITYCSLLAFISPLALPF